MRQFSSRSSASTVHLSPEAEAYFAKKGCEVLLQPTPEAIGVFNRSHAKKRAETKGMGTPHFEPHGWVHQWANDGDAPLVLLQANISEEGVPAVVMVQPPSSGPTR